MPYDDFNHDHNHVPWPAANGELTIHPCERDCDYCSPSKRKCTRSGYDLRKHVYAHHINPTNKPASHPGVWITGFEYVNGPLLKKAWLTIRSGRVVEDARIRVKRLDSKRRREARGHSSVRWASQLKRARKSAPSIPTPRPARTRRTLDNSDTTENDTEVEATNITVVTSSATPSGSLDPVQVAFGSSSTRNSGPEGFEQMSDVAFEREYKIMDARLEESRAKQDESRAKQEENRAKQEENRPIQKQLLMEAERERRTSLR